MSKPHRYVLCVSREGDELSVVWGKVYRVLDSQPNDPDSMLRVVDETFEDYLYPRQWFAAVSLSQEAITALEVA